MIRRLAAGVAALACAAFAAWLAWHHPLSPAVALAGCAALAALTAAQPAPWPLWLLPLLPAFGLMPWSGWVIVEEIDLMVLAVAAGGYARLAGGWPSQAQNEGLPVRNLGKVVLVLTPMVIATLVSLARGVADAGGLEWGWWQGYREPLNSLRLAKPIFEVLLLLPLWQAAYRADAAAASAKLCHGMLGLLLVVALSVVSERLAFTGLADFSSDYRATGPFWEMHIGGAALDAALALALPFAVAALARARTPWRWAGAAAVLGLALYASLVTFSRIVYIALPLGLAVWAGLRFFNRRSSAAPSVDLRPVLVALLWLAGFALLAQWGFASSGYRGLLALFAAVALGLPLAASLRGMKPASMALAVAGGLLLAALVGGLSWALDKGAYLAFGLCWTVGAGALWLLRHRPAGPAAALVLAAFVGTLSALVAVALHWGGAAAWAPSLSAALVLLVVPLLAGLRRAPAWPESWRWQGQLLGALAAAAGLVGVFGGGAYMGQRLSATSQDSQDRTGHWQHAVSLLQGSDWLFGKGLGRFWASQWLSDRPQDRTGEHRWLPPGADRHSSFVVLTSGTHDLGSAEALQLSQRVPPLAPGLATLRLDVRAEMPVRLDAGLCSKHLLYPVSCQGQQLDIAARPGVWQAVEMPFRGESLSPSAWYAPRWTVFSISLGRHANRVEIDNLRLADANGYELLRNGDFEQGLARWFFSSDRMHLPFHAKNLAIHLLFEQGVFGLLAFTLLAGAALWRTSFGAARRHPLAPVLAAAIAGVLVIGAVDSLLDMPRIAFLTLWLMVVAVALPADGPR